MNKPTETHKKNKRRNADAERCDRLPAGGVAGAEARGEAAREPCDGPSVPRAGGSWPGKLGWKLAFSLIKNIKHIWLN